MENLKEKESDFFNIAHIDYDFVKNSEHFQKDPLLKTLADTPHFKSLENKTQVTQRYLCEEEVSTRLSHTFQVIENSEKFAEYRDADIETAVRIAAFHDDGHSAFGHIGERTIKEILKNINKRPTIIGDMLGYHPKIRKFRNLNHEMMSAIIFDEIIKKEEIDPKKSEIIREGILKHGSGMLNSNSHEGKIVGVADKISYLVQDLKDSERIGFKLNPKTSLGETPEEILNTVFKDIKKNAKKDFFFSDNILKGLEELKEFMYKNFYASNDISVLDRMLCTTIQFVFLNWCSEIFELRDEIGDKWCDFEYYKEFFQVKSEEEVKSMLDFENSIVQFFSLSDEEVFERSEIYEKESIKKRKDKYKNLGIIEKYGNKK